MSESLTEARETGFRLLKAHRPEELLSFMEVAVRRFPDDSEIRLLYATALLPFRAEDARWETAYAVSLDTDDPVVLTQAARLMIDLGDRSSAASYANRAATFAPADFALATDLDNVRGVLAALDGDNDMAEPALRAAYELEPQRWMFANNLARFLHDAGRDSEALKIVNEFVASNEPIEREAAQRFRRELLGTET